jgi:ParB family chromosome partitioning protein
MTQQWTQDTYAESKLKEFGASFTVKDISMSSVNWAESSKNHARADKPIVEDMVEDYALAMESGDAFPMIVLMLIPGRKDYIVISGNHRFKATELLGEKTIKAYVATSDDPAALDVLPRIFNRGHGLRQNKDEAIRNAIWSINAHHMTIQRAAELFGIKTDSISRQIKIETSRAVLASGGVKEHRINNSAIYKLSSVALDNVMIALGRIVADAGLSVDQTDDMVKDVRKVENKSEPQQMAAVAEWENRFLTKRLATTNEQSDEPSKAVEVKKTRSVRVKFITALTSIERLVAGKKRLSQLGIENKDAKNIQSRLHDLSKKLNILSGS